MYDFFLFFHFSSNEDCSYDHYCLYCVFCIFCSWLETNTPYYYSECVRVLGPVMEQGLEKAKSAAVFISENTSRFIVWVKETTPLVIEWVRPWLQLHLTLNI